MKHYEVLCSTKKKGASRKRRLNMNIMKNYYAFSGFCGRGQKKCFVKGFCHKFANYISQLNMVFSFRECVQIMNTVFNWLIILAIYYIYYKIYKLFLKGRKRAFLLHSTSYFISVSLYHRKVTKRSKYMNTMNIYEAMVFKAFFLSCRKKKESSMAKFLR